MRCALLLTLLLGSTILASCSLLGTRTAIVCDGVHPQWVLDARDYDGGGCVETIPFSQAPADADWTPVCTGYCTCPPGEMSIDDECEPWPADRPWPTSIPYPWR
jgi:hypothetical protein